MQQDPDFPLILEVLAAAYKGDGEGFVSTAKPTIDQFWGIVFLCSDNRKSWLLEYSAYHHSICSRTVAVKNRTFPAFEQMHSAVVQLDRYGVQQAIGLQFQLICSAWPYAAQRLKVLELEAAMLLVTADFDV